MTSTAKKTRKLCSICNLRPLPSLQARTNAGMGSDMDFCAPCFEEAGWENSHSDQSHEEIAKDLAEIEAGAKVARLREIAKSYSGLKIDRTQRTAAAIKSAILDFLRPFAQEAEGCWICHPELNKAKAEYAPREGGTSRQGQVIHAKGSAEDKAALVAAEVEKFGGSAKVKTSKAGTVLTAEIAGGILTLRWDTRGRYEYLPSSYAGRKIRNVSEALRVIAQGFSK